jgi:hypothetical protein
MPTRWLRCSELATRTDAIVCAIACAFGVAFWLSYELVPVALSGWLMGGVILASFAALAVVYRLEKKKKKKKRGSTESPASRRVFIFVLFELLTLLVVGLAIILLFTTY